MEQNKPLNSPADRPDDGYTKFSESLGRRFFDFASTGMPLFTTNATGLFDLFLNNLPPEARQHYTCRSCRNFVERHGGLVAMDEKGEIVSVLWEGSIVPAFFQNAVREMRKAVLKSEVTGVFLSDQAVLGNPITGIWQHMSAALPMSTIKSNAHQIMAQKAQDRETLINGLTTFPIELIDKAITLLQAEALDRPERFLEIAQWARDIHAKLAAAKNSRRRDNILWMAAATDIKEYCHLKNTVIASLLEDLAKNVPTDTAIRRFNEKVSTTNYQRSTAPPTAGGIRAAEKFVEERGLAGSLRRRYAKRDEIPEFVWKPKATFEEPKTTSTGVFGHLTPKNHTITPDGMNLPNTVMTLDKFRRTVLPTAEHIEVRTDNPDRFMGIVTAADPDAPNMLQWNNTFSHYYHSGVDMEIKRRVESAGGQYEGNEIRCSIIWEGENDLDLHCITPWGDHIYYSDKRRRCGGWLDVDANGIDGSMNHPVENIRWSLGKAQSGHYRFYTHQYNNRERIKVTPFKAELKVNGQVFVHYGEAGNTGWQQDVFVFNYVKGQVPTISNANSSTPAADWNVPMNQFVPVTAIVNSPNLWGAEPQIRSGQHAFFLLDGCRDLSEGKGRGFFNEHLKSEFREIRKTLELYTANTPIEGAEDASACGVGYSKDSAGEMTLRVTANGATRLITIDRWD